MLANHIRTPATEALLVRADQALQALPAEFQRPGADTVRAWICLDAIAAIRVLAYALRGALEECSAYRRLELEHDLQKLGPHAIRSDV